jgi:phosphatidylserine/phosphatidylglycerophosphate/cardiolipin synthase-like enzyme
VNRELIVMPEDGPQPLLDPIISARESLRIKMFVFSAPEFITAVIDARQRGLKVRVMLNPARRSGESDNEETRKTLLAGGVEVIDSNPDFDMTHEKSMVVDDRLAVIQSLNWETKNLTKTRDYAIITTHKHEVQEVADCFDADWERKAFAMNEHGHMIWCKGNARERIAHLIDNARETLWLQNERYQDQVIIERIVRAAVRGVKVHVMARPPHTLKMDKMIEGVGGMRLMRDVGCHVHRLTEHRLHGKLLVADGERAILGSINLSPGTFESRRELAIETRDEVILKRLTHLMHHDWKHSEPLDLTDAGLIAEMKKHDKGAAVDALVLDGNGNGKKK